MVDVVFDSAYFESTNIKFLADRAIDGYIAYRERNMGNAFDKRHFGYDAQ